MWLTSYMAKNIKGKRPASVGRVSSASGSRVAVEGASPHRDVDVVLPYGFVAVPPSGVKGVTAETESGQVLLGVIGVSTDELLPGEIMLCSEGGASLVLKNNGQVIINGKVWD